MNVIGCLNDKQLYSDNPEYLALLSQVTVEEIPPGNYSGGIKWRLCEIQDEMRKPFLDTINGLSLQELRERASKAVVPWQRMVIVERMQEAFERRKREVEELYARKRIPGLTKLYEASEDTTDREILLGMIRRLEDRVRQRDEEERRRQDEAQRRQEAIARWQTATLAELITDKDREEYHKEWLAAIRPKVTTVAEIADRLEVSQATMRKYMPFRPVFVDQYTVGWASSRRDVTAYYYRPEAEDAVVEAMARHGANPRLKLVM